MASTSSSVGSYKAFVAASRLFALLQISNCWNHSAISRPANGVGMLVCHFAITLNNRQLPSATNLRTSRGDQKTPIQQQLKLKYKTIS